MRRLLYIFSLSLSVLSATAQDDVFDLLDEESESTQYTYATFKGTKLLNGQTNETPGQVYFNTSSLTVLEVLPMNTSTISLVWTMRTSGCN